MPAKKPAASAPAKSRKQEIMEQAYSALAPTRPAPPPVEEEPPAADSDGDETFQFNIDDAVGLIPANTPCICTVTSFAPTVSQNGSNMFKVILLIDSSPYEPAIGRKLFRNLVQTDAAMIFTKQFLVACGLDPKGTHKRRQIEGLQVGVIVGVRPEKDGYDAQNEPSRFKTLEQIHALFDKYEQTRNGS